MMWFCNDSPREWSVWGPSYHRNNLFYSFLHHWCRMIHGVNEFPVRSSRPKQTLKEHINLISLLVPRCTWDRLSERVTPLYQKAWGYLVHLIHLSLVYQVCCLLCRLGSGCVSSSSKDVSLEELTFSDQTSCRLEGTSLLSPTSYLTLLFSLAVDTVTFFLTLLRNPQSNLDNLLQWWLQNLKGSFDRIRVWMHR
jgi:hypothetical protein